MVRLLSSAPKCQMCKLHRAPDQGRSGSRVDATGISRCAYGGTRAQVRSPAPVMCYTSTPDLHNPPTSFLCVLEGLRRIRHIRVSDKSHITSSSSGDQEHDRSLVPSDELASCISV